MRSAKSREDNRQPVFPRWQLLCAWMAALFWFTAPISWGWGLQVRARPIVPQAGPVEIPKAWVKEGFPSVVDVSQPIRQGGWSKFSSGILDRGAAGRLVLPRDFEMLRFLLTLVPGRSDDFNSFVYLPRYFARTAYEKPATELLRPILRRAGLDECVYALAAWSLASLNDKQSVFVMLTRLPEMDGVAAKLTRKSLGQLGWVLPPEDAPSETE